MARPRKEVRRYHLTLSEGDAELVEAEASRRRLAPTTALAQLALASLRNEVNQPDRDELAELRHENTQLRKRVEALRRHPRGSEKTEAAPPGPRWNWPIEELLADREWWESRLPQLNQLMGRGLTVMEPAARKDVQYVDAYGYSDYLSFLFPPITDQRGQVRCDCLSVGYRPALSAQGQERQQAGVASEPPCPPSSWIPVLRHFAVALSALEMTQASGDGYLYLRVQDELRTGWVQTLRSLIGRGQPEGLPPAKRSQLFAEAGSDTWSRSSGRA